MLLFAALERQAATSQYGRHTLFSLSTLVGDIFNLEGFTCRNAEPSMSPEDDLFRGLSSESVSELVVSSSLMDDLVDEGVGGEVLG